MRRIISILLLVVFGLPLALPMLAVAQDEDAGLPACCRRNGKHHCSMRMAVEQKLAGSDPQFRTVGQKCPCCPFSVAPAQPNPLAAPPAAGDVCGDLVSHPTGIAQTEARRRIARERSHGKRGPPAPILL